MALATNSSNSSGARGNTNNPSSKQISPSKRWCFTLNNYTEEEHSSIVLTFRDKCSKWIIGKEIGESGTPHLQGYCEFKTKVRATSALSFTKRIHWEKAKGTPLENYEYCKKDSIFEEYGFPKPIKVITELYGWQKEIEALYLTEPDDRKVFWFYDDIGNIGKSAFIKYMIVKYGCLYCSGGKYSDIMNLVFNQDMDECRGVMFNIPRANRGEISYASLESIKDGLVCNTKYETGVKVFNAPHLFVFANFPPSTEENLSPDRWVIRYLSNV